MDKDGKYILRKIILDIVCLCSVGLPVLLFFLFGNPYKRGFFCNDESISHPFKDSTVTSTALYFIGFGIPILTVLITEYYVATNKSVDRNPKVLSGYNVPQWAWECYKVIGVFLFGAACSQLTTDIAKYSIGRLRPHFMDVCQPNINCSMPVNQFKYFEEFTCLGTDKKRLHDMRLSFLSGHSSFSAYTMLYLAMYIQVRWNWRGSKLVRHVVQFAAISFSWFTALSRVSDYKHHWSDVLAGSFQGALVAVLVAVFVSDLFNKRKRNSSATNSVLPMVQQSESCGQVNSEN